MFCFTFFVRFAYFYWLNKGLSSNIFKFLFNYIHDITNEWSEWYKKHLWCDIFWSLYTINYHLAYFLVNYYFCLAIRAAGLNKWKEKPDLSNIIGNMVYFMPSWIHQDNDKRNFFRTSRPDVFCKIGVFRSFVKLKVLQNSFLVKQTLAQRFSCEFCEISKNTFLHGTSLVAASVSFKLDFSLLQIYTLSLMS